MRVQIIGVGVVGSAQAYLASHLGHEVIGVDHHRTEFEHAKMVTDIEADVALTFICTPERAVPGVVEDIVERHVKGLCIIKSAVPIRTTQRLTEKRRIHICHNPEFLRESSAFEDVLHPSVVVIGECCAKHGQLLRDFYRPLGAPIMVTEPTVSETVKLTLNAYLSTLITFWNQIDKITASLGISTEEVAAITKLNPRVSEYGTAFFGSPFGGKCLPKDLDQLIEGSNQLGVKPELLELIKDFNEKLTDGHAV